MAHESVRRRRTILDRLKPTRNREGVQHESDAASLDLALSRRGSEQPQFAVPPVNVHPKKAALLLFEDLLIPAKLEDEMRLVSQDKRISFSLGLPFASGATSRVRLGVKKDGEIDQVYAMKEIFVTPGPNAPAGYTRTQAKPEDNFPLYTLHLDDIKNEVNNMIKARSNIAPHFVISLSDSRGDLERIYIGMPVMQGTALGVLDRIGKKEDPQTLRMHFTSRLLHQVSRELKTAHANSIAFGEIKLDNILINLDGTIVQSDFGGSIDMAYAERKFLVDTPLYRAPEFSEQVAVADLYKANLFALGAMLTESYFGQSPLAEAFWLTRSSHAILETIVVTPESEEYIKDLNATRFRRDWIAESSVVVEALHEGEPRALVSLVQSPYVKYFLDQLFAVQSSHSLSRTILSLLAPKPHLRPSLVQLEPISLSILQSFERKKDGTRVRESLILDATIRQLATEVGEAQALDEVITTELERERFLGRMSKEDPQGAEQFASEGIFNLTSSYASSRLLFGPTRPLIARRNSTGSTVKDFYFRARDIGEAYEMIEEMSLQFEGLDLASSGAASLRPSASRNNMEGQDREPDFDATTRRK